MVKLMIIGKALACIAWFSGSIKRKKLKLLIWKIENHLRIRNVENHLKIWKVEDHLKIWKNWKSLLSLKIWNRLKIWKVEEKNIWKSEMLMFFKGSFLDTSYVPNVSSAYIRIVFVINNKFKIILQKECKPYLTRELVLEHLQITAFNFDWLPLEYQNELISS